MDVIRSYSYTYVRRYTCISYIASSVHTFHSYKHSLYSYVASYLTLYSYNYVAIAMYLGHKVTASLFTDLAT